VIQTFKILKFLFGTSVILITFSSVRAGLNNFTDLIYVDEWLIERKIDIENNQIKCRASIPANATWFGARVRLDSNNELVKPIWLTFRDNQLSDNKLTKIKKHLNNCRSELLFLPDNW
tara:strand:+ start:4025 stop:4378 length:354 start_codon:yes stop_codon:yes gene_type:complete